MVLSNDFTCPKGHKFVANAKLRARCPECGLMARKAFGEPKVEKPQDEAEPEIDERVEGSGKSEPEIKPSKAEAKEKPKKQVKILKQGKTRESKVAVHMASKKAVLKTGLIKHKKVSHRAIPAVNLKPRGNKEHKIQPGGNRPYWHDVADKYGL